ncbi:MULTISPECIES: hypothetical protein [unclassified Flavobacterium]|uniref:hypothetical protein n=1 Tax=unclassified Flavobacterium TaxID=196869 RepID=UPI000EB195FC|nr:MULTISPECIES: hypothetical protein [unclassified Flavobacterium]RKS02772.1 hypothetical protein C8C84_2501 [Flavobacterium sp. 102]
MKEKILTYAVISFAIINIWTLYLFFDYFTEKDEIMHSLGLFLNFVYTAVAAVVLGGILLLIRLVYHYQKKANPLQANFLYVLSGLFNLNIFIIWAVSLSLNMLELGSGRLQICAIASLLLGILILLDIYKSSFKSAA